MFGPPGCGKTYLARATAGEIRAGFISVGISDVLEMWIGTSERNLHAVFEQARQSTPCVLFFDEVDALGGRRSDMVSASSRHVINQFLAELDGVDRSNEGVLVLAATNAPWHVDGAFRRPGRFDRVLFVPPPDAPARAAILRLHCRNKPSQDLDFDRIAAKTDGYSGADLKAIVDMAVESKLREAMRAGAPKPLSTKDLLTAAKNVQSSTREWFATARNYALVRERERPLRRDSQVSEILMGGQTERARLLIGQRRFELAERELCMALAQQPNDPMAHSLMAFCLTAREQYETAANSMRAMQLPWRRTLALCTTAWRRFWNPGTSLPAQKQPPRRHCGWTQTTKTIT